MALRSREFASEGLTEKVILVAGSKGGVGTSTVALNLSVQIAQLTKYRIALLDLARPFGQISLMLGFKPRFTLLDALDRAERLDPAILASLTHRHKTGIHILAGALHAAMKAEQRPRVTIDSLVKIIDLASDAFDYVVVDLGFVNVAEWRPVFSAAGKILLVTEASVLALGMLNQYLEAASSAGIAPERFQIVLNRWRQNDDEILDMIQKDQKVFTRLPNDYRQLSEAVKLGMPLMGSSSNALISNYRGLAAQLTNAVPEVRHRRGPSSAEFVVAD